MWDFAEAQVWLKKQPINSSNIMHGIRRYNAENAGKRANNISEKTIRSIYAIEVQQKA